MSKIIEWVNASLHLLDEQGSNDYQDHELAEVFKVRSKKVCEVTGKVNSWLTNQAVRYDQQVPLFWNCVGHVGVWQLLTGDAAAQARQVFEWKKSLRRDTAQLRRTIADTKLKGLTQKGHRQLLSMLTMVRLTTRLRFDVCSNLPANELDKHIDEFLAPYKKEINNLLEQDDEKEK